MLVYDSPLPVPRPPKPVKKKSDEPRHVRKRKEARLTEAKTAQGGLEANPPGGAGAGASSAAFVVSAAKEGGRGRGRAMKAPMHRSFAEHAELLNAALRSTLRGTLNIDGGLGGASSKPALGGGGGEEGSTTDLAREERRKAKLLEVMKDFVVFLVWDGMQLVNVFQQNWVQKVCLPSSSPSSPLSPRTMVDRPGC
jgi:hypothetical protein